MNDETDTHQDTEQTRIESHGEGTGAPRSTEVEVRARELARIEGRDPEAVTDADRDRAWREIHDQTLMLSTDEARSHVVASSNPADIGVDTGHQVKTMQPADEQDISEREVKEGVQEAEHERMLEGQESESDDLSI